MDRINWIRVVVVTLGMLGVVFSVLYPWCVRERMGEFPETVSMTPVWDAWEMGLQWHPVNVVQICGILVFLWAGLWVSEIRPKLEKEPDPDWL